MKKYLLVLIALTACTFAAQKESYSYSSVGVDAPSLIPQFGYGYRLASGVTNAYDFSINYSTNLKESDITYHTKYVFCHQNSYIAIG